MGEKLLDFVVDAMILVTIIIVVAIFLAIFSEDPAKYEYVDLDGNIGYSDKCYSYQYLSCQKGKGEILVKEFHQVESE